jgi:hypothetical protein
MKLARPEKETASPGSGTKTGRARFHFGFCPRHGANNLLAAPIRRR